MEEKALFSAQKALQNARDKAYAFYKEGLLNISEVNEIDAKYYQIAAQIQKVKEQRKEILNELSSLLNFRVDSIDGLPNLKLKKPRILQRPDLKVLKTVLHIAQKGVKLSEAKFYPTVGFQAAWKHQGQNALLTKNDYRNKDLSYVALEFKYNLFDGGADEAALQKAKIKKYQAFMYYENYLNKAKTDYKNDLNMLKALKYELKAAKAEIKARKSYYEYIYAKFKEGLADSSKLNDAIAKLAAAKAKKEAVKADIFYYTIKANLDGGNHEFY
jgi:outer membrane protein TolC